MSDLDVVSAYFDGGCEKNPGPAACAAVAVSQQGEILLEDARRIEHATNNIAEYQGLLLACSLARLLDAKTLHLFSDSQLVVQQMQRYWAIVDPTLGQLHGYATSAVMEFDEWTITHVPREQNARADWLCNQLLDHQSKRSAKAVPGIQFRLPAGESRPGWARMPRPKPMRGAVSVET